MKPRFSFCESVTASGRSPWHIREIPEGEKLKTGGGITTPFLCGRKVNGWDLDVEITEHHLTHTCKSCFAEYTKRTKE